MPETSTTPRAEILAEASRIVHGDRNESYGSPTQNFQDIADVWSVQFRHLLREGARFESVHVAQAMMGLKLVRMIAKSDHYDSWLDIAGYVACGWECASGASALAESATESALLELACCESRYSLGPGLDIVRCSLPLGHPQVPHRSSSTAGLRQQWVWEDSDSVG